MSVVSVSYRMFAQSWEMQGDFKKIIFGGQIVEFEADRDGGAPVDLIVEKSMRFSGRPWQSIGSL